MALKPASLAQLALLGIAAVWGATFVMVQDAVRELPVLAFLAYRFLGAAAIVGLVFARQLRELDRAGWCAGALLGVLLTFGYVLQTAGLLHTTATNVAFGTGLFVVFTPLLAAIVLKRHVSRRTWMGAGASAAGVALLAGFGPEWHPLGDALVVGCALAFAGHLLLTDFAVKRHAVGALLGVQLASCGLICLAGAGVTGDLTAPSGETVWIALAVTAVVASALGFWIQSYAQRHAPPARTALILASEPAFAALFAMTLGGERLTVAGWIGALMMLSAVVAVELLGHRKSSRGGPSTA